MAPALAYLIIRSGFFPKVLGYLFLAAAIGYLVDSVALLLVPSCSTTPVYFAVPIAVSEIAFPLWLVIRGLNRKRWDELLHKSVVAAPKPIVSA